MNFKTYICLILGLIAALPTPSTAMQQQQRNSRWGKYALWTAGVAGIGSLAFCAWLAIKKHQHALFMTQGHAIVFYSPREDRYHVIIARHQVGQATPKAADLLIACCSGNAYQIESIAETTNIYAGLYFEKLKQNARNQKILELTSEEYEALAIKLGPWQSAAYARSDTGRALAADQSRAWSRYLAQLAQFARQQRMAHAAAAPAANA